MEITECRYILREDGGTLRTVARLDKSKLVVYATGNEHRDIIEATKTRVGSWAEKASERGNEIPTAQAIHIDLRK
jgi:hypothetical protein